MASGTGQLENRGWKMMKKVRKLKRQTMDALVKQLRIYTDETLPDEYNL